MPVEEEEELTVGEGGGEDDAEEEEEEELQTSPSFEVRLGGPWVIWWASQGLNEGRMDE